MLTFEGEKIMGSAAISQVSPAPRSLSRPLLPSPVALLALAEDLGSRV